MIIGLTGVPRAGKTEVTKCFGELGYQFASIGLEIKRHSHELVCREFSEEEKEVPQDHLNGKTPRDLYIAVGNLDEFVHGIWVAKMFANQIIPAMEYGNERFVIESVGKQFQWDAVKSFANKMGLSNTGIIEVKRPGADKWDNRSPVYDDVSFVVDNNGTIGDLHLQVAIARDLMEKTWNE